MKRLISIFFVIVGFSSVLRADTIFYDITFSSPEHTVGRVPVTGSVPTRPSGISFGSPIVSSSLGLLQDQPLVFDSIGNRPSFYYDQIRLSMDEGRGFYYTSFDILTHNLIGSRNQFVLLYDMPSVHKITFKNNGMISLFYGKDVSYQDDKPMHFEILIDITNNFERVFIDGQRVFEKSPFLSGSNPEDYYLRSLRFSHGLLSGGDAPDYTTAVAIDNIIVADHIVSRSIAPFADAGNDEVVLDLGDDGIEEVAFDGSGSFDIGGDIVSWVWTDDLGDVIPDGEIVTTDLSAGVHTVTLTVTDDEGMTDSDTVVITVEFFRVAPVADAGDDEVVIDLGDDGIEEVMLDGSGSSDSDGDIVSWVWTDDLGDVIPDGEIVTADLSVGVHTITLTVTDDGGLTDTDTIVITVEISIIAPFADAGDDKLVIDLDDDGIEEVTLDGSGSSDSDGDIVSWVWTDDLGDVIPDGEIVTADLSVGVHMITLTVTDDGGLTDSDRVVITVRPPELIWYVDDSAVGADDGLSWNDAFRRLSYALNSAIYGDTILVAEGTYLPDTMDRFGPGRSRRPLPLADPREASFKLKNGVTVKGGYAGYGAIDPNDRNVELYETILSGDLRGDDEPVALPHASRRPRLPYNPSHEDNCYHVFYHPDESGLDATAVLDGFTVIAGNANGDYPHDSGGGMYNGDYCNLTVTDCMFSDNLAEYGGGMYNGDSSSVQMYQCTFEKNTGINSGGGMYNGNSSSPTVVGCTFTENSSHGSLYYGYGGGIYSGDYCSLTVTNCTFSDNSARFGGGMFNYEHSNPTISNCIFSGNSADTGGGMYNNYNNPMVANCKFSNNSASQGGGIDNWYATLVLNNCIFSGNLAINNGGGMANSMHSDSIVTNCTFSGNSANLGGGGMYNELESNPIVSNCIIWGNTATYANEMLNALSNPVVSYCDIQGGYSGGTNIIDVDPMFVRNPDDGGDGWGDNLYTPGIDEGANDDYGDLHLLPDSPCIDTGDNSIVTEATDLDGNPRISGAAVDMGAYEVQNTAPIADAGDDVTVYAGPDGLAKVKLDGSGSFDADGDALNCFWFNDADELIAGGVDPNVVFAAGVHVVELVVDDGTVSSEPNSVVVTVIEAMEAVAYVFPRALNARSRGRYVIARMELPDGISKDDVAEDSLRLIIGGTVIESVRQRRISSRGQDYVFGFFDRGAVVAQADGKTKLDIVIAGELTTGQCVYGEDSIKIVKSQASQKKTLRRMPVQNSRGGRVR